VTTLLDEKLRDVRNVPTNNSGALVEYCWQWRTKFLAENPGLLPLCPT